MYFFSSNAKIDPRALLILLLSFLRSFTEFLRSSFISSISTSNGFFLKLLEYSPLTVGMSIRLILRIDISAEILAILTALAATFRQLCLVIPVPAANPHIPSANTRTPKVASEVFWTSNVDPSLVAVRVLELRNLASA